MARCGKVLSLVKAAGVRVEVDYGFVLDGRASNGRRRRRARRVAWAPAHVVDAATYATCPEELVELLRSEDPVAACRKFAAFRYLGGGAGS